MMKMNNKIVIAMLALQFNGQSRDNVFTVQGTKAKEIKHGHLRTSCKSLQATKWTHPFFKGENFLLSSHT